MQQALKQAQALQAKMAELQKKMEQEVVEGKAGGGMVTVVATCKGEIKKVNIDASLMDPKEKEVLEDLIIAALNQAKDNADKKMSEGMQNIASSLGLPPSMLNFPF